MILPHAAGNYYIRFVSLLFIYIILATGYNLASGYCGMTTFSAAALYGVGAYASAIAITRFGMPFGAGVACGILAACLVSLVVSIPAFKVKGDYLALVSIGVLEIAQQIMMGWQSVTGGSVGFYVAKWKILGFQLSLAGKYYAILAAMVLCLLFQRNLVKSRFGRDFMAMRDNEVTAGGLGINNPVYRVFGFLLSAALSGLAGAIYASNIGYLSPDSFGFSFTLFVLLMVVVGGSGTLSGPVVGAAIATVLPEFFNASPDLKQIAYGLLLVVLTQVLPGGVVGTVKKRFREIEDNRFVDADSRKDEFRFGDYRVAQSSETADILTLRGLTKRYGGLTAVNALDMTIKRGTVHSLIGPNGAGKTTTVNMITGIEKPSSGSVEFNGKDITGIRMWGLMHKGVARTYQHVRLFGGMSVIDNVVVGARLSYTHGLLGALFRSATMRREERASYEAAMDYLRVIGLGEKLNEAPGNLSSGQQKLLELARALCTKPELLVLDEPCAGLTETETAQFSGLIKRIRNAGISVLLIEHHMSLVMEISDYITVLDYGKNIAEGRPEEIAVNGEVRKAYLGVEDEAC
jgi:ABC-type branched-subunit amino acid transport system ATPase component/ABC-type branched-subunit amino acid transport system permease subunit